MGMFLSHYEERFLAVLFTPVEFYKNVPGIQSWFNKEPSGLILKFTLNVIVGFEILIFVLM